MSVMGEVVFGLITFRERVPFHCLCHRIAAIETNYVFPISSTKKRRQFSQCSIITFLLYISLFSILLKEGSNRLNSNLPVANRFFCYEMKTIRYVSPIANIF